MPQEQEIDNKMKRLEEARKKVNDISNKKQKLQGQIESQKEALKEFEEQCKNDFNCNISDIPQKVDELDKKATESLNKAEKLLQSNEENE